MNWLDHQKKINYQREIHLTKDKTEFLLTISLHNQTLR